MTRRTRLLLLLCIGWLSISSRVTADDLTISNMVVNTVSYFASGFSSTFQDLTGRTDRVNLKNDKNTIAVLNYGFSNLGQTMDELQAVGAETAAMTDANIQPAVLGPALCYPSPFRQAQGTQLGYRLSKNMDIEIQFYDMLAHRIIKKQFKAGSIGGKQGYNKIDINLETFDGYILSAGVYFYLLLYDGKVLAKGKVGVLP